jgi:hypothetical protein
MARLVRFRKIVTGRRSFLGTCRLRRRLPSLQGVIEYLDNCARIARFSHNLEAERLYSKTSEFVLLHTHGQIPRPPSIPIPPQPETPPMNREIPIWKREVLARPMRKVLKHWEVDVWSSRPGYSYKMRRMKLSCGHLLDEFPISLGAAAPQRRRCRQCANEAAQKRVIPITRKVGNR